MQIIATEKIMVNCIVRQRSEKSSKLPERVIKNIGKRRVLTQFKTEPN